jgi:hypothetical protein
MENKTNDIEEQLVAENSTKLIADTLTNTRYTYIFLCKIALFTSIFLFIIIYFTLR